MRSVATVVTLIRTYLLLYFSYSIPFSIPLSLLSTASVPTSEATSGTEIYELSNLCKGQFPTQMHRKVDGAVIKSRNDKNLDCTVTFSTEYVSQRFHIRFEEFSMACGDHLYIYDSANAIGHPRAELTCRFIGAENIPPIKTRGHYVTLKFVADEWGIESHRFTMVITAYKDTSQGCRDAFLCGHDMCIANRLLCDSVNNCEDGSDEHRSANCTSTILADLFNDSTTGVIAISGLIVISLVIVVLCVCICQRQRNSSSSPRPPNISNHSKNQNEASGSNGTGTMIALTDKSGIHSLHPQSTLESIHKSGNLHLPAESQGYNNNNNTTTNINFSNNSSSITCTRTHLRHRRCFLGSC
ncbi:unnamed protein product [Orchesella dallaii]|uniref:CUB domain-containing protein n=1 Tax=Orchesella dallaii TaxID=48710 RepID=A0ABP1PP73_9HEXA